MELVLLCDPHDCSSPPVATSLRVLDTIVDILGADVDEVMHVRTCSLAASKLATPPLAAARIMLDH